MRSFLSILQLKIAGGYILLLALLCAVVFLVRLEHGKMEELDSREHSTNMRRKAVNRTFEKLLEFSFHDHFLLMQDSADIRECGNSCAAALDALNGLKPYYAAEQHPAIDTVSMLLLEKERLLYELTNTLSGFPRADSLLLRKAPGIVRQVRDAGQPDTPSAKKGRGLLNVLIGGRNKKSAYANRKEKEMRNRKRQSSVNGEFIRLQKDMYSQYADYRKRLEACSDSLRCRNRELDARISGLIHDFERAADMQYTEDMEEDQNLYQSAFQVDRDDTKGNTIAGKIDVQNTGYFITSIPYDKNFTIYVDGDQTVPKKVNTAFLGFPIESGEHSVVIIYHASGVAAGKFLSLVGLVMMAVIFLIEKRRTKRGTY